MNATNEWFRLLGGITRRLPEWQYAIRDRHKTDRERDDLRIRLFGQVVALGQVVTNDQAQAALNQLWQWVDEFRGARRGIAREDEEYNRFLDVLMRTIEQIVERVYGVLPPRLRVGDEIRMHVCLRVQYPAGAGEDVYRVWITLHRGDQLLVLPDNKATVLEQFSRSIPPNPEIYLTQMATAFGVEIEKLERDDLPDLPKELDGTAVYPARVARIIEGIRDVHTRRVNM